jgi:hypothetical protein
MPVCQSGLAREWVSHLFHGPINEYNSKPVRFTESIVVVDGGDRLVFACGNFHSFDSFGPRNERPERPCHDVDSFGLNGREGIARRSQVVSSNRGKESL